MRKTKNNRVHLFGSEDARAVCGHDWMADQPALAVSWTNRDKANCKACLDECARILRNVGRTGAKP